jgi:hypothetical protein
MPTVDHDDKEMYKISDILHQKGRGQVNAIVMGDFNSVVDGFTNKVSNYLDLVEEMREGKCSSTYANNKI